MRATARGKASRKTQGLNGFREYSPPAASGTGLDLHWAQTAEPLRSDRFLMEEMK
jgi:hypothetical protein